MEKKSLTFEIPSPELGRKEKVIVQLNITDVLLRAGDRSC